MPREPLIDFDNIDLEQVVATKEDIYELLMQRGTFQMVDGVVQLDPDGDVVVGYKDVRADEWWAKDHLPGRPLFPGTMMIEGAAQLCTFDFLKRRPDMVNTFVGFGGVGDTRFRMTVEPGCRLILAGKIDRIRSRMFHYYAQGFVGQKLAFETTILGVVV